MKSVLISIRPKWCELIASGEKTVEVRKTRPKLKTPFKCYIYATKPTHWSGGTVTDCLVRHKDGKVVCGRTDMLRSEYGLFEPNSILSGKVIGEFVCDRIDSYIFKRDDRYYWAFNSPEHANEIKEKTCLTLEQIVNYAGDGKKLYGWHISDLKIYDKPKELGEFIKRGYPNCEKCAHVPLGMSTQRFVWHNDFCGECRRLSWEKSMKATHFRERLTRPPQSWCYVWERSER